MAASAKVSVMTFALVAHPDPARSPNATSTSFLWQMDYLRHPNPLIPALRCPKSGEKLLMPQPHPKTKLVTSHLWKMAYLQRPSNVARYGYRTRGNAHFFETR